jgi:hypothetical protein
VLDGVFKILVFQEFVEEAQKNRAEEASSARLRPSFFPAKLKKLLHVRNNGVRDWKSLFRLIFRRVLNQAFQRTGEGFFRLAQFGFPQDAFSRALHAHGKEAQFRASHCEESASASYRIDLLGRCCHSKFPPQNQAGRGCLENKINQARAHLNTQLLEG